VSYALLPAYWGKGYATELAQACIAWAFEMLTISRLVSVTHPNNIASQHVLEKINMHYSQDIQYSGKHARLYVIDR